ncbi:MAG: EAL domain-containing protein [Hyphomicrobiales bacterium]
MVEADLALYHSKAMGKGVWSLFERDMNDRYLRRQLLKGELAKAIELGTLSVRYQPIVEAATGRIVGCEALSRWHHPEHGNVSPAEYIPLAEEMGIITKLTESVIRTATRECARWPDHVTVSVNLSSIDFQRDGIGQIIQNALETAGLPANRLIVEITETAVISNEADMIDRLTRIRRTGVGIALDDFGTGYSSLSYLHRLPLDRVKIDRSFVAGIETGDTPLALLHGITDLVSWAGPEDHGRGCRDRQPACHRARIGQDRQGTGLSVRPGASGDRDRRDGDAHAGRKCRRGRARRRCATGNGR